MTDKQLKVALRLGRMSAAVVPRILARLDPQQADYIPIIVALGQIGSADACRRLEELATACGLDTEIGQYARKALTLCGSARTRDFAQEALESAELAARDLGFWMTTHGELVENHVLVGAASRAAAEAAELRGTAFLEAAAVCRPSATAASWRDLEFACETALCGQHSVWLYRPLIRSGLPSAGRLLLEVVLRLWACHGKSVGGITYAFWALAEEAMSDEQVEHLEAYASDRQRQSALVECLRGLQGNDREWGVQVASRLRVSGFDELCAELLAHEQAPWQMGALSKLVPMPSAIAALASVAKQPGHQGIRAVYHIGCAEGLAAQPDGRAFEALVDVLRTWEGLPDVVATAFARSAARNDRLTDCLAWAGDTAESTALRQACTVAIGARLAVGGEWPDGVEALAAALTAESGVAGAAAVAAGLSGQPALLPALERLVGDPPTDEHAFQALHAIARIRGDRASSFLLDIWVETDLYFAEAAPTTALALLFSRTYEAAHTRVGWAWDAARGWLDRAYRRLAHERGKRISFEPDGTRVYRFSHLDSVVEDALLGLALEWADASFADILESEAWAEADSGWRVTPEKHLRWLLLARRRPAQFAKIALRRAREPICDGNKPALVKAMLETGDATLSTAILALAKAAKTQGRRAVARELARVWPHWLDDVPADREHAELLRDVAAFAAEREAVAMIERLVRSDDRRVRMHGREARKLREARQAALLCLARLDAEACPHRRLWWVNNVAGLADEAVLECARETEQNAHDMFWRHAVEAATRQAQTRLEREARHEDWHRAQGHEPWLW